MNLGWKFFVSHLFVGAVGLLVLAFSTAFVAPETFSMRMTEMPGMQGGAMMHGTDQADMMMTWLDRDLERDFRDSVNSALWRAGLAAMLAAAVVSWLVSARIVRPIRQVAEASHHIAEGHYEQRLQAPGDDELGELVESFNCMAQKLAATEAMRQRLIGDVSHELKTPLASIKGYMEGLQDGVIPATPETFQLIYCEAERLQRLVHDLQELSRAEAGALRLDRRPHDLREMSATVMARLRPQFVDKGVTLRLVGEEQPLVVRADRDRIEQVITNLLGNALQYTPAGGTVTLAVSRNGSRARLAVQDTGIGLAPEDVERVFQRFYRVDKSRSRTAGGGSGVGLTIARHIVEAHDGRLWAESAGLGHGSTFILELPLG